MLVEVFYETVPLWLRITVVVMLGLAAIPLMFRHEIKGWGRPHRYFDVPIREAIDHYVRTFPHSFRDGADLHAFEVLHRAMCNGTLPVVGTKGEGASLERISTRRCKRLTPMRVIVPTNPASPHGIRFDLMEDVETIEPLVESDSFPGYTGLRVRSTDFYRLWPKDIDNQEVTELTKSEIT